MGWMIDARRAPCKPKTFQRAILSEQDIVRSRWPWMTPSQVWMPSLLFTGMVPSPDSILVRNWPRAFLELTFRFQNCFGLESFRGIPIWMLVDTHVVLVRAENPSITTWSRVDVQMKLSAVTKLVQLLGRVGSHENWIFCSGWRGLNWKD